MRRINRYITLLVLVFLAFGVQAQKEHKYFEYQAFGVKVGGNYSTIALQPAVADLSGEMSYNVGLVYVFSNKKNVGLQLELLYSSRKWGETFDDSLKVTTELKYIEFPLMTNINLGSGRMKYIINLGTYISANIDKSVKSELPWNHPEKEALDARRERGSDFGLILGGGLRYISPVGIFQLDARFTYGYQKVYNEDATGFRYSNMSVMSVGLIYMINLKKDDKH